MGREIRRVPPNGEHPRITSQDIYDYGEIGKIGAYRLCYDETFDEAADAWEIALGQWIAGDHPSQLRHPDLTKGKRYWEWRWTPPDRRYYRPAFTEEPTWYQVYEDVSEGTPVSPPFETAEELIDYLAANGDFWAQKSGTPPPTREAAAQFVRNGFGFSGLFAGGKVYDAYDASIVLRRMEDKEGGPAAAEPPGRGSPKGGSSSDPQT